MAGGNLSGNVRELTLLTEVTMLSMTFSLFPVTENKFFEIISAAEAWHINEDYSPPTVNGVKPTNSAIKVRDLFEQVTDRYRPLPGFEHRLLFFIDIQIPLLEGYPSRISSATDAFETLSFGLMRAVPGTLAGVEGSSIRLTNGLNGLQRLVRAFVSATWMETIIKEWSEDMVRNFPSLALLQVC